MTICLKEIWAKGKAKEKAKQEKAKEKAKGQRGKGAKEIGYDRLGPSQVLRPFNQGSANRQFNII